MVTRVLLVTFQQALRSMVLSLLPITTLTLIAWSLAGSQSGNTSDPLKASIWFWLGAHLIPFQLKLAPAYISTFFNYLPIAAILLPIISIRSSFFRAVQELNNERAARSFLTLWYGILVTLAALLMQSETVHPIIYLAPIYGGLIVLISTLNLKSAHLKRFRFAGYLFLFLFGLVTIAFSALLAINFPITKSLTAIVEPGWFGGFLLVILQILYLPNIVFATFSYLCGIGFTLGSGTIISPFKFNLSGIPAIPVLSALPNGKNPWMILFLIIPTLLLLLNQMRALRNVTNIKSGVLKVVESIWIVIPISLFLGYQSGGTFISKNLSPFGISWWSLPAILISLQLAVFIFLYLIPSGLRQLIHR